MTARSVLLEIEGMTCDGCAQTIKHNLKQDEGVKGVRIDWRSGIAEVSFDPSLTDEEKVLENRVFQRQYKARLTHTGTCC